VSAPKKKTKKDKEEAAENVEPKKPSDLAEEFMPEMLRSAGVARSHAIKLSNVTYGKDLGENLLKFAVGMEELYKQMQSALNGGDASKLVSLYTKAKAKEDSDGASAKANLWLGPCSFFTLFLEQFKKLQLYLLQVLLSSPEYHYKIYVLHLPLLSCRRQQRLFCESLQRRRKMEKRRERRSKRPNESCSFFSRLHLEQY